MVDKRGVLRTLAAGAHVHLELGCGARKRDAESVGVDIIDSDCVDIVGDILEVLSALPNATVDRVTSFHCLEHLAEVSAVVKELARVTKIGARLEFVVPHYSNPYFFSDPTHRTAFGLYSFCYFATGGGLRRKVPHYEKPEFTLESVDLVFKSTRPFCVRHGIKRVMGKIVNLSNYGKELYEEFLPWIFPCYEIRYVLTRRMV